MRALVGTAAWTNPKSAAELFPEQGSHLERYSAVLPAVEINTSFYRDHAQKTYVRWAATVPNHFRFAVKLLRAFTHGAGLAASPDALREVVEGYKGLGEKLGVILVQLPPKLRFEPKAADLFFRELRGLFEGDIACEPRHTSWLSPAARALFAEHHLTKVEADPEPCPVPESQPFPATGCAYIRLHGSPQIYVSDYGPDVLEHTANRLAQLKQDQHRAWCIFDNTTFGHATHNAVDVERAVAKLSLQLR